MAAACSYGRELRADIDRARAPVLYMSHGAPIFAVNDPARIAELRSWGRGIGRPRGILAITPHYASRRIEVGATGSGFAMYDLPGPIARRIPRGLSTRPPSEGLALRVEALLSPRGPTTRGDRRIRPHDLGSSASFRTPTCRCSSLVISMSASATPWRSGARAVARRRDPPLRERRDDAQSGGRRPRSGDSALGRGIRRVGGGDDCGRRDRRPRRLARRPRGEPRPPGRRGHFSCVARGARLRLGTGGLPGASPRSRVSSMMSVVRADRVKRSGGGRRCSRDAQREHAAVIRDPHRQPHAALRERPLRRWRA